MTDEQNYLAVITLSLPDGAEAVATITLAPASGVAAGGRVKPLRDCTLADLQEFADKLETQLWADYRAIRLIELAETTAVTISILDANGRQANMPEDWQDHVVILPPGTEEAPEAPPQSEQPAGAEMPAAVAEAEETPAEEAPPAEAATADDPEATAADAVVAPAVEEIEPLPDGSPPAAPVETRLPPRPRELRIAGRRRPLGHPTWTAVDILINEPAFRDCQAHALSSLDREVAGVLVGPPPEKQPDGRYVVHITDSIIARHTRMHGASVTYTPESWRYVTDRLAALYPDESAVMVGWYHTHPGFGIFLSAMDLFIHQNFFTQLWHVALVLDPVARRSGFFSWDRAKTQVKPYDFPWPAWANGSW
jgi:proteasome lid subunit RPN8/RPN11